MTPPEGNSIDEGHPIDDLVRAVLEGRRVDWPDESTGGERARLARHLRVVAAIASAHREEAAEDMGGRSGTSGVALETWGHLRVLERVGRGAFGDVHRAWDTRLDREVALKLIPAADTAAAGASSIIHEGRLLARVRHPNVVTIYGADQIGNYVGLWMEFVVGRTLEDLLRAETAFECAEVTRIGIELCHALSAVHGAGLLHRDIKAQNVMRADDGRIVLMDFGTGRELAQTGSDVSGTPLYLSPEVLRGEAATIQGDIYSLGVLLYRLATGGFPVWGTSLQEILLAHERRTRAVPRSLGATLPPRVTQVIERALAPEIERRYPSAKALCADLAASTQPARRRFRAGIAAAILVGTVMAISVGSLTTAPSSQDVLARTPPATPAPTALEANVGPAKEERRTLPAGDVVAARVRSPAATPKATTEPANQATFEHVYLAGFMVLGEGWYEVWQGDPIVDSLKGELRRSGVPLVDAEPLQFALLSKGGSRADFLATVSPQAFPRELAIDGSLFENPAFWQVVGQQHDHPLIVTGRMIFTPRDRAQIVPLVDGSEAGRNDATVGMLALETQLVIIDGRTGKVAKTHSYRSDIRFPLASNGFRPLGDLLLTTTLNLIGVLYDVLARTLVVPQGN